MDQQKNKGQQSDSRPDQPRRNESQPRPDDSETPRDDYRNQGRQDTHRTDGREKGRGSQGERNRGGGISNRRDREMEKQEELPDREPRQSER